MTRESVVYSYGYQRPHNVTKFNRKREEAFAVILYCITYITMTIEFNPLLILTFDSIQRCIKKMPEYELPLVE